MTLKITLVRPKLETTSNLLQLQVLAMMEIAKNTQTRATNFS